MNRFDDDPAHSQARVREIETALAALPPRDATGAAPEVDPATLEALGELGYLE